MADIELDALAKAADTVRQKAPAVLATRVDVSRAEDVERLARETYDAFGAAHVLCNNAGVAVIGAVHEHTLADWQWVINVNLWGVIHGVRTFLPRMLAGGDEGHIVNTASMAGLVGMRWLGIYSASKFAVVGLTEALHRELTPLGIGVSVLCPMIVDTQINENSVRMRPGELRNAEDSPIPPAAAMAGGTIAAPEVARRVVRGIERGDLYILTHPEQRTILRRRAAKLDAMFEEENW
jgi:NAD(P)-dependent dehydrogenase (short-subunit alcohol dehydrogenase family)